MDKNRKFTVTWNELESLVEGLVTEQLHKYGLLNENHYTSEDDSSEDDLSNDFKLELEDLIQQWENGDIYTDDQEEDYIVNQYIRHYKRGQIDFDIDELYQILADAE